MESKLIFPVWQPVGFSTHLIARTVAEKYNVKTSHTGTLDPMAEGVVIILLDEERLKKYEYAEWHKTYEFDITFGIKTDTFDGLGFIEEQKDIAENSIKSNLNKVLLSFIGPYVQTYPIYSAKKIKGKASFEYARSGQEIELPQKEGTIFKISLEDLNTVVAEDKINNLIGKIKKVNGDFRQSEVLSQWEKLAPGCAPLLSATINVETSKGIYIRSLSQDICKRLDTIGFVSNLCRVKNGSFSRANSEKIKKDINGNYRLLGGKNL